MRFLLIKDNPKLAQAVVERLQLDGHAVDHADTLDAAGASMDVADYDLVLLEILLPNGDGRNFLARQRKAAKRPPRDRDHRALGGVGPGGSSGLRGGRLPDQTFRFSELEARCRVVLRRQGGPADNRKTFAGTTLDSTAGELRFADRNIALRNRELRLLEVFSKTHLMDRLFSLSVDDSENAIEAYVGRLRKRLEGSGARIETVRGLGYRMVQA